MIFPGNLLPSLQRIAHGRLWRPNPPRELRIRKSGILWSEVDPPCVWALSLSPARMISDNVTEGCSLKFFVQSD